MLSPEPAKGLSVDGFRLISRTIWPPEHRKVLGVCFARADERFAAQV